MQHERHQSIHRTTQLTLGICGQIALAEGALRERFKHTRESNSPMDGADQQLQPQCEGKSAHPQRDSSTRREKTNLANENAEKPSASVTLAV